MLFVLGVIKNFLLRLVNLVVKVINAVFKYMLVILKRAHNIFELSILKLHPKKSYSIFLTEEKMSYALYKTINLDIRNGLDLKIARKWKIMTKECGMIHPIG